MRDIVIKCEEWLSNEVKRAGAKGIILGLSGGIDSSVLAALGREALGREGVLGVIMPCNRVSATPVLNDRRVEAKAEFSTAA